MIKTDDKLLYLLKSYTENFISGEELSKRLSVSRSVVWKEIHQLRQLGYVIEAQPHWGYRFISAPDRLFADEIKWKLGTEFVGQQIFSYRELDSTNDVVWRLGQEGLPEGSCVFAEYQKKGRGRLGRSWAAPKNKAILFSVLLRPKLSPVEVPRVTLVAALSVIRALKALTGISVGIKWPNDIVYKEKKLCGILTEMSAETDRVRFVVLGMGLNVNTKAKDLLPGATSLREITGAEVSRLQLARLLLIELEKDLVRLKKREFDALSQEWEEHSETTGKRVVATLLDRNVQGHATGIDRDGALWIRKDNGLQERIVSGDIRHLRGRP